MLQYSIRGVKLGRKISFVAKLKCGPKYSENHKLQRVIFLLYPMVEHMHEPKEKGTRLQTSKKATWCIPGIMEWVFPFIVIGYCCLCVSLYMITADQRRISCTYISHEVTEY